jgi:hypothetical protein
MLWPVACSDTEGDGSDGRDGRDWHSVSIYDLQLPPEKDSGGVTMTPVEWTVAVDDPAPGLDTIRMVVQYAPLTASDVKGITGRLIWGDQELELCADAGDPPEQEDRFISIRGEGDGFLRIGDIFQQTGMGPGCDINDALAAAFADHGVPGQGCVSVTTHDDVKHEYCAPLLDVDGAIYDDGATDNDASTAAVDLPPAKTSGDIAMTPVEWGVAVDDFGPGVDTAFLVVEYAPLSAIDVKKVAGRLVWGDQELELCADSGTPPEQWGKFISIRGEGDGFVHVGDIFQQTGMGPGCEINDALDAAFDDHGVPDNGCVSVTTNDDVEHEYCAPLLEVDATTNDDGGDPGGPPDVELPSAKKSGAITMTPVEWGVATDDGEPGVHTVSVIVEYAPLSSDEIGDIAARLIWDDAQVELCTDPNEPPEQWGKFISIREEGDGFVHVGDIFQHTGQGPGCEGNAALEAAFEDHGPPTEACVSVTTNGGVQHEYCAPLGGG